MLTSIIQSVIWRDSLYLILYYLHHAKSSRYFHFLLHLPSRILKRMREVLTISDASFDGRIHPENAYMKYMYWKYKHKSQMFILKINIY